MSGEDILLDFNRARVQNGERGRQLIGAAKEFTVKAPLSMNAQRELSVDIPPTPTIPDQIRDISYFRQAGLSPLERWYGNLHIQTNTLSAVAAAVNTLFAYPFLSGRGGVLDAIAFNVTTGGAAGSKGRVGIYTGTSSTVLYPDRLVVDGGEFDTTSTGVKSSAINVALAVSSLYWLVYIAGTAAPTVRGGQQSSMPAILGLDPGLGNIMAAGLSVSQTYGVLPDSFPSGASALGSTTHPIIAVRYSG